jgi:hypothetical protein
MQMPTNAFEYNAILLYTHIHSFPTHITCYSHGHLFPFLASQILLPFYTVHAVKRSASNQQTGIAKPPIAQGLLVARRFFGDSWS